MLSPSKPALATFTHTDSSMMEKPMKSCHVSLQTIYRKEVLQSQHVGTDPGDQRITIVGFKSEPLHKTEPRGELGPIAGSITILLNRGLDKGTSKEGPTTTMGPAPGGEGLWWRVLPYSTAGLPARGKAVVPGAHREKEDLPKSDMVRFSVRAVHTRGSPPHDRLYRPPVLLS